MKTATRFLIFSTLPLLLFWLATTRAAAAPQFMVSWEAQSFVPSWYKGKIFPSRSTPVSITFNLIDEGKIADLKKTVVRWYINDELIKNESNGLGITELRFITPDYSGQETEIRISIPDYRGNSLDSIVRIPVVAPQAVIESNHKNWEITRRNVLFKANPFFFNIPNLNYLLFNWSAGDEEVFDDSDMPWNISLDIDPRFPSGFETDISVRVRNIQNELEMAGDTKTIKIK